MKNEIKRFIERAGSEYGYKLGIYDKEIDDVVKTQRDKDKLFEGLGWFQSTDVHFDGYVVEIMTSGSEIDLKLLTTEEYQRYS